MHRRTIKEWLERARGELKGAGVGSAGLDAELILADVLGIERSFLHSHGEKVLDKEELKRADGGLDRRKKREPLAYITGWKEFYGRKFTVTPEVLIPRPETEELINVVKRLGLGEEVQAVDVGTGSGVIGITLKLEFPKWNVIITDKGAMALKNALRNAQELGAEVLGVQDDLLSAETHKYDLITANLPYVDKGWAVDKETEFEPEMALFAADGGLELIKKLLLQGKERLKPNGYIVLEADTRQRQQIVQFAEENGYELIDSSGLILAFSSCKK